MKKKKARKKPAARKRRSTSVRPVLERARAASLGMATLPGAVRARALEGFAALIETRESFLLQENAKDLAAQKGKLEGALYERLKLDSAKIRVLAKGLRDLAATADPLGRVLRRTLLDEGLVLEQVTVPLGVVAVVFESRPDVIPQILSLVLLSGNACVLKGGSEAIRSNQAFMALVGELGRQVPELPQGWAALVESREAVHEILSYPELVDLVIPRGSNALVRAIMDATRIPVLGHADGICHLYVHTSADTAMAVRLAIDAKCQYPSACNAIETLLVDRKAAQAFFLGFGPEVRARGVELRGCPETVRMLKDAGYPVKKAAASDYGQEFGNLTLAVRVVAGLDEALEHIARYGSRHTDAIVARDAGATARFLTSVDSACVFANASTRFADGYRFGLGAEVGISTAKTHARGPVGVEGLLSTQYRVTGRGHVVADYAGDGARAFKHQKLGTE